MLTGIWLLCTFFFLNRIRTLGVQNWSNKRPPLTPTKNSSLPPLPDLSPLSLFHTTPKHADHGTGNLTRDQYIALAKLGEQSERYKDMVSIMQRLVVLVSSSSSNELTVEERNLLSVAYKNTIGTLRTAWRTLSSIEHQEEGRRQNKDRVVLVKQYRSGVEKELSDVCAGVLGMLETYLVPSASTSEARVFYLTMKGDYRRYLVEIKAVGSHERKEAAAETLIAYKAAEDIAAADLSPSHPIRLGLALNLCVFYYEILNASERACDMARQAFDDAVSELDKLQQGEDSYKDCTVIIQLLKDNFILWTSNMPVEDNYYS